MKVSAWFENAAGSAVKCTLCPHRCVIQEGKSGICHVRINKGGSLYSENFGMLSAIHLDPIEKKPLYHYYPGSQILSIGSVGCNLGCLFCQNCEISQVPSVHAVMGLKKYEPIQVTDLALQYKDNIGIAYTYNEPAVWYEFMLETAMLAAAKGLKNVMVTNGFINREPLTGLLDVMDAFSVDMKGFTNDFYRKITSSSLQPVKEAIQMISSSGRHLELVNLVIPGLNDDRSDFREMVKWISGELGKTTVLHLSRYFPMHKLSIEATPPSLLDELHEIASQYLDFVYVGNVSSEFSNTYCPACSSLTVLRKGYSIYLTGLDDKGRCARCNNQIIKHIKQGMA
ncbi:MAG TPA: AmmeMemoRadiSam system radical SAM enzyme [Bacteroidales bacterium]|nr:AmmeMemoRadiSam system radical SAM enzyme [Bacteroidales bacterium]HPT00993.1 AmmeMemoRadiSam system radical SAM enzyme [Bacteroidales bacterium]